MHKYETIRDTVKTKKINGTDVIVGSSLDDRIKKYKRKGTRILNFWRDGSRWVFKIMAPRKAK